MRLLIYNRNQFGYHIDTLRYCQELSKRASVSYVCLDAGKPRIEVHGVSVVYIKSSDFSKMQRAYQLISHLIKNRKNYDVFFAVYHPGISIIRLWISSNLVLDVRSRNVSNHKFMRIMQNFLLRLEIRFFKNVSFVSSELADWAKAKNFTVIPVAADPVYPLNSSRKSPMPTKGAIVYTYVGTFEQHDLPILVNGFLRATEGSNIDSELRLIGSGSVGDIFEIERTIREFNGTSRVKLLGYLNRDQVASELRNSDVGIVHIPTDGRYDGQPSTKLFEYWNSGIPVLASNYDMNRKLVTAELGLLYDFNAYSISASILRMSESLTKYDAGKIREEGEKYLWENVIRDNLWPLLLKASNLD